MDHLRERPGSSRDCDRHRDGWPDRLATAVAAVANGAPGRLASRPGDWLLHARVDGVCARTPEEGLLAEVRVELTHARHRVAELKVQYARDRRLLAQQLVANYETPPPSLMDVILTSNGFRELLNTRDISPGTYVLRPDSSQTSSPSPPLASATQRRMPAKSPRVPGAAIRPVLGRQRR
jgi:hypothetical protein